MAGCAGQVFPVQEPAEDVKFGKASKGSPWGASPSSVLPDVAQDLQDRSLASFIKTMYPNVQGRNVISTRKKVVPVAVGTPNAVHAAWVYRYRAPEVESLGASAYVLCHSTCKLGDVLHVFH